MQPLDHADALRAGEIRFQRCAQCGHLRWPPASICPECLSDAADWSTVSGRGHIWSFAVQRSADDAPALDTFALAAVVLDEGPFMFGRIVDPPPRLAIGQAVEAVISNLVDDVYLLRFRVIKPGAS
jgi:uncharacterized protein